MLSKLILLTASHSNIAVELIYQLSKGDVRLTVTLVVMIVKSLEFNGVQTSIASLGVTSQLHTSPLLVSLLTIVLLLEWDEFESI